MRTLCHTLCSSPPYPQPAPAFADADVVYGTLDYPMARAVRNREIAAAQKRVAAVPSFPFPIVIAAVLFSPLFHLDFQASEWAPDRHTTLLRAKRAVY